MRGLVCWECGCAVCRSSKCACDRVFELSGGSPVGGGGVMLVSLCAREDVLSSLPVREVSWFGREVKSNF